ncbi:hypothetical protein K438DRAFT_1771326 [Mycena galopus ATCC 62051]|nr:hypothetical protein K438DRAFT_1771326 [Mycena galopus ATCC 62051]
MWVQQELQVTKEVVVDIGNETLNTLKPEAQATGHSQVFEYPDVLLLGLRRRWWRLCGRRDPEGCGPKSGMCSEGGGLAVKEGRAVRLSLALEDIGLVYMNMGNDDHVVDEALLLGEEEKERQRQPSSMARRAALAAIKDERALNAAAARETDSREFATPHTPTLLRMSSQQYAPLPRSLPQKQYSPPLPQRQYSPLQTPYALPAGQPPKSRATAAHSALGPVRASRRSTPYGAAERRLNIHPRVHYLDPQRSRALRPEASHYILVARAARRRRLFATHQCSARLPQKTAPGDIADTSPLVLKKRLPASPYLQAHTVGSGVREASPQPPVPPQQPELQAQDFSAVRACHISRTLHRAGKVSSKIFPGSGFSDNLQHQGTPACRVSSATSGKSWVELGLKESQAESREWSGRGDLQRNSDNIEIGERKQQKFDGKSGTQGYITKLHRN